MLSKSDILFKILLTPDVSLTIKAFLFVCLFLGAEGVGCYICPAVEPACCFRQGEKEIKEKKSLGASFNIQKQRVTAIWHFDRMDQLTSRSSFFLFNLQG